MASHAEDYSNDSTRLQNYARQVVGARMLMLTAFGIMNTQRLLQEYLTGVKDTSPFPLLHSTRAQLELLAVVFDVSLIIKDNAGTHSDRLVERITTVDESLIKSTFGTRNEILKGAMKSERFSKLRENKEKDIEILEAKNILTRLTKLSKSEIYKDCLLDYERLSEYCHPNYGMNMLHIVRSNISEKLLCFSLTSSEPFKMAFTTSISTMLKAATLTNQILNSLDWPFGEPIKSFN